MIYLFNVIQRINVFQVSVKLIKIIPVRKYGMRREALFKAKIIGEFPEIQGMEV